MKIRYKLIAAFLLVVLVPLAFISYMHDAKMSEAILKSYEDNNKSRLDVVQSEIERLTASAENYIHFLANDSALIKASYYAAELESVQDLARILPEARTKVGLSYLEVIDLNGKLVFSTLNKDSPYSAHSMHKTEGMPKTAVLWFNSDMQEYEIHKASLITRKKVPIGYMHGAYVLDKKFLQQLSLNVTVSLFDADSGVLTAANDHDIEYEWGRQFSSQLAEKCKHEIDINCGSDAYLVRREILHGVHHVVVASPLMSLAGKFFGALIITEEAPQIHKDLANARGSTAMMSGFALIIVIFIGSTLAAGLSRPIEALKKAAENMGRGNLDARVDIKSKDELGVLATTFNGMGKALSKTTVSKNYVEKILASMGDALFVLNENGDITRVNQAASTMLGYSDEEFQSKQLSDFMDESIVDDIRDLSADYQQQNYSRETSLVARDGAKLSVYLSRALLHDDGGNLIGAVCLVKDISALMLAEATLLEKNRELEKSNKELDQFAYVVSHDLKAPLRAISNLAQWIEEDNEDKIDEDSRNNLNLMRARVLRMEGLINGMLEFSRIGRVEEDVQEVNVQQLLGDVVDSMPVPEGFSISIADNMPAVPANKVRLSQVFANLISNAIKYRREEGGEADVSVTDMGKFYQFNVHDNGPGIAPADHGKVFEIFKTLNARDKVESTGVGLTLVKRIVEENGGEIILESEEGEGACFSFTWPKYITENEAA